MDKDFCLIAQRNKKKLYFSTVLKHIQDAYQRNKKDSKGVFIQKYGNNVFDDNQKTKKSKQTFIDENQANVNFVTGKDFEKLDYSQRNGYKRNQPKQQIDTENNQV